MYLLIRSANAASGGECNPKGFKTGERPEVRVVRDERRALGEGGAGEDEIDVVADEFPLPGAGAQAAGVLQSGENLGAGLRGRKHADGLLADNGKEAGATGIAYVSVGELVEPKSPSGKEGFGFKLLRGGAPGAGARRGRPS